MFNENSEFRQFTVKQLLFFCQGAFARFFERNQAVRMDVVNALKTFVANKQDEVSYMYAALLEKLEIVNPAFTFMDADDFAG